MRALSEGQEQPGKTVVLFQDEASFYRQPTQAWLWAWAGRGQPKMPYSHRANTLMRVVGLLDAHVGRVAAWDFPKVTAKRLAQCFAQIPRLYPDAERIYLVMDNWPVHAHPLVKAALAKAPQVHPLFLPTYAPWLNPIEKLWRWAKQKVSHAHPWSDDFLTFRHHVREEFHSLAPGSAALKHYCGLDKVFCL